MKALLLGATGMVGAALLNQLLASDEYTEVSIFVRRSTQLSHPKLKEYIVDFQHPDVWKSHVNGDILFSCLGTTLAVAGSKANQFRVDYTYQYEMAEIAAKNGVKNYVLVSSAGAKSTSGNFYLGMKGKLDDAVRGLNFETINILRPGQLYGNRQQRRVMEKIAVQFMFLLNSLYLLRKYRPIHANEVARAMIHCSKSGQSGIYTLDQLFDLK